MADEYTVLVPHDKGKGLLPVVPSHLLQGRQVPGYAVAGELYDIAFGEFAPDADLRSVTQPTIPLHVLGEWKPDVGLMRAVSSLDSMLTGELRRLAHSHGLDFDQLILAEEIVSKVGDAEFFAEYKHVLVDIYLSVSDGAKHRAHAFAIRPEEGKPTVFTEKDVAYILVPDSSSKMRSLGRLTDYVAAQKGAELDLKPIGELAVTKKSLGFINTVQGGLSPRLVLWGKKGLREALGK